MLLIFALSFNASIDSGTPTHHHFDGVFGCCNSTIQPLFNFTVYNITSLPIGNHALRLTLLNSFSGYSPGLLGPGTSNLAPSFIDPDYVLVDSPNNERPTASVAPSSDVHSSTTFAVNPSAKSTSRYVSTVSQVAGANRVFQFDKWTCYWWYTCRRYSHLNRHFHPIFLATTISTK